MENNYLNGLELYRGKQFADLVDENMISNMLQTRPHEVASVISYVFGVKDDGYGTSIDFLTGGLGKTMIIDNRQFEWNVLIDTDRAIEITAARWNGTEINAANAETITAGLGNTPIQLWLKDKWFASGAILEFDDKEYQVRVQGAPYQDGAEWVYTVVMSNGQSSSYVPGELLMKGRFVSRLASAYEEYSDEADIINYSTNVKLRNHLTTLRLQYDITGSAASTVLAIALKDPKTGKTSYMWEDYQSWLGMREWYRRLERFLVYSKFNANAVGTTDLMGSNGRPVYIGSGLLEQIAPANKRFYTELTAELLEDYLNDLAYNILGMNERKFVALTGEMGMREFDRVLKEKVAGFTMMDTKFVTGSGQELTLGGQFTTYKMTNGIELTMKHFPLYDNIVYNRKLHPITKKPLESYRMTFIDFTSRDGQPNVVKVVKRGRELVQWYTGGSIAPGAGFGKSTSTLRSNARDGYQVHFLGEVGIMVRDPRACGELICDSDDTFMTAA